MNPWPILVWCLLSTPTMHDVRQHIRAEAWSEALVCLDGFRPSPDDYIEACFYRAVAHCRLNHKKEAIEWAEIVRDEFDYVPKRYRDVATLIVLEAETWKDDDFGDVYRDMRKVADRLRQRQAGEQTQQIQKDVLAKLDKMIKEKEDALNKAKADSQTQNQAKQQQKPADDSTLPIDQKKDGEVDMKKVKEYAEVWGKLPPKERTKAMTELTRKMPARYRNAIEAYFKSLERKTTKK
jgi:hypothetical protein